MASSSCRCSPWEISRAGRLALASSPTSFSAAFAAGAVKRGFDMIMLTSDLASMIAGVRRQLDELKAATK